MTLQWVGPFPLDLQNPARGAERAARVSLGAASLASAPSLSGDATAPGLYALRSDASGAGERLVGLWAVLDERWLEDGAAPGAKQLPPIFSALMAAFVEVSWWKAPGAPAVLSPLVVLEWTAPLAARSDQAPASPTRAAAALGSQSLVEPSAPASGGPARAPTTVEEWDASPLTQPRAEAPPAPEPPPSSESPTPRPAVELAEPSGDPAIVGTSLISVARGELRLDRGRHLGAVRLLAPAELLNGASGGYPVVSLEDWLTRASEVPAVPPSRSSAAVELFRVALPGGRTGAPLAGWLTRDLELNPVDAPLPGSVQLVDRDVRRAWISVATSTALSTAGVLILAYGIAELARIAGAVQPEPTPPTTEIDPGPAISPCSADHDPFIRELRCQIDRMADPTQIRDGTPRCGDQGSSEQDDPALDQRDLQPTVCGLLDRAQDGWTGNFSAGEAGGARQRRAFDFAELAAAQACLNALGHPGTYQQLGAPTGLAWADPGRFLRDERYSIASLQGLIKDLRDTCDGYRDRLGASVKGAVLATHIGGSSAEPGLKPAALGGKEEEATQIGGSAAVPDPTPAVRGGSEEEVSRSDKSSTATKKPGEREIFRERVRELAEKQLPVPLRPCFEHGFSVGFPKVEPKQDKNEQEPHPIWEHCGDATDWDLGRQKRRAWARLGGATIDALAMDRYVVARFGEARTAPGGDLVWGCHLALSRDANDNMLPVGPVPVRWGLELPVPRVYATGGGGVPSQLVLDAALRQAEDGGLGAGVCWDLVREQLSGYTPVHPLLAEPDPDRWVSGEQQLCAQVCAASGKIRTLARAESWWTRSRDLGACVTYEGQVADGTVEEKGLDLLRLPWNQSWYRWTMTRGRRVIEPLKTLTRLRPSTPQICAFHILAQDLLLPDGTSALVGGKSGEDWAGTSSPGARLAGGQDGAALSALDAMKLDLGPSPDKTTGTYDRDTCGDVAAQCFTSIMLTALSTPQRYRWVETWDADITRFSALSMDEQWAEDPWCAAISRYIGAGSEVEAKLDKPCRDGVDEARQTVRRAISLVASSRGGEGAP